MATSIIAMRARATQRSRRSFWWRGLSIGLPPDGWPDGLTAGLAHDPTVLDGDAAVDEAGRVEVVGDHHDGLSTCSRTAGQRCAGIVARAWAWRRAGAAAARVAGRKSGKLDAHR